MTDPDLRLPPQKKVQLGEEEEGEADLGRGHLFPYGSLPFRRWASGDDALRVNRSVIVTL